MKNIKIFSFLKIISFSLVCTSLLPFCSNRVKTGMIIIEETPGSEQLLDDPDRLAGHYIPRTRISSFLPGDTGSLEVLTNDFFSASSPDISFDGRSILFSAQQKRDEKWEIWEMNLQNLKYRKIISSDENCTDPVYMPGNRLVFSRMTANDTIKSAHCLFTCNLDGSDLSQITFNPADNLSTTVLRDGRLLTVSTQLFPEKSRQMLMVLRPDGTKAEMFYKGGGMGTIIGSASETPDGKLLFVESENELSPNGDLVSISYNRPLHSRINLTTAIGGDFQSVIPVAPEICFVSFRNSASENFSLFEFDPVKKALGQKIITDPGYDISGALIVKQSERPKKLPSEVDKMVKTGLLLCQDINYPDPFHQESLSGNIRATKIEVFGTDTTYGVVNVEKDGSFQLKVMADTPFRIRTIDENGTVVNGPGSWLYLRPNERRGCIGCHEDPEMVPENKVSLAILKPPVIIPVHIKSIKEKTVELE